MIDAPDEPASVVAAPHTPPSASTPIVLTPSEGKGAQLPRAEIVRGTGQFARTGADPVSEAQKTATGDITFHFVNAGITDVAKAVLGDLLKLDYLVSPALQATVTLQTTHPIGRDAVLPALETALRFAGAAIVHADGVWRLVPAAEAPRQGEALHHDTAARTRIPGFGIEIVPLAYVAAEEMQRLLEPLAPQSAILRVDKARNLLVLGGTEQELAALKDQIATFDVDWLEGMSFALLPLKVAAAKAVAGELEEILGRDGGPVGALVRIVPIERMNALLIISQQPRYLESLRGWVERLDRGDDKADVQLYVYAVQNGRAQDLAATLRKIFGGDSGGGPSPASTASGSPRDFAAGQPLAFSSSSGPQLGSPAPRLTTGTNATYAPPSPLPPPPSSRSEETAGSAEIGRVAVAGAPQITADEVNNALLILSTAHDYAIIEAALKRLDVVPLQVLIETAIAEVTLTNQLQYGVQFFLKRGNFEFLRTATTAIQPAVPLPGAAFLFSSTDSQAILSLLESLTTVNIISAPQMMVLNNQTASLQVGNQVPVATQAAVAITSPGSPVVNAIEYRDTGVILKVTPRVNESGLVLMDVAQEVSDVQATTSSSLNSPTFSQRRFASSVAIRDGETIGIGGLISDNRTNGKSGIPVLRDLPVVGPIFGDTTENVTRTELLVLITPHIVRTDADARGLTDEFRRRMRTVVPLEKRTK